MKGNRHGRFFYLWELLENRQGSKRVSSYVQVK